MTDEDKAYLYTDFYRLYRGGVPKDASGLTTKEVAKKFDLLLGEFEKEKRTATGRATLKRKGFIVEESSTTLPLKA